MNKENKAAQNNSPWIIADEDGDIYSIDDDDDMSIRIYKAFFTDPEDGEIGEYFIVKSTSWSTGENLDVYVLPEGKTFDELSESMFDAVKESKSGEGSSVLLPKDIFGDLPTFWMGDEDKQALLKRISSEELDADDVIKTAEKTLADQRLSATAAGTEQNTAAKLALLANTTADKLVLLAETAKKRGPETEHGSESLANGM